MDRISKFVEGIVSCRDPDLAGHHSRSGCDAHNFALHLGYSADDARVFKRAAEIHDIGKMAIPETILNKASRLTPAEMMLIRHHTEIGHEIIFPLGLEQEVQDAVLLHHENFEIMERDRKFYDPELLDEFTSMMQGLRERGQP